MLCPPWFHPSRCSILQVSVNGRIKKDRITDAYKHNLKLIWQNKKHETVVPWEGDLLLMLLVADICWEAGAVRPAVFSCGSWADISAGFGMYPAGACPIRGCCISCKQQTVTLLYASTISHRTGKNLNNSLYANSNRTDYVSREVRHIVHAFRISSPQILLY